MPQRKQKKVVKKTTRSSRSSLRTTKSTRASRKVSRLKVIRQKFDGWKWTESYNSFLLGIVVIIVAVLFVASFIHQQSKIQQTSSITTTAPTPTATPTPTLGSTYTQNGNTYYVVKADDSLWIIALQLYNNGYKWTDIAKANNLANPGTIFKGDKLLIPNPPTPSSLGQINQKNNTQQQPDAIVGDSYTVQKGDTLWTIAVRVYSNGYKWTDIAKANNLANPGLIHSGNILALPR